MPFIMAFVRRPGCFKRKFTPAEDIRLISAVEAYGFKNWASVSVMMHPRTPRQCRERWTNYLNPKLINDPWTSEEECLLVQKVGEFGTKWKAVGSFFANRSRNQIQNHWKIIQRRLQYKPMTKPTPGSQDEGGWFGSDLRCVQPEGQALFDSWIIDLGDSDLCADDTNTSVL
jgi:hypothetical protein